MSALDTQAQLGIDREQQQPTVLPDHMTGPDHENKDNTDNSRDALMKHPPELRTRTAGNNRAAWNKASWAEKCALCIAIRDGTPAPQDAVALLNAQVASLEANVAALTSDSQPNLHDKSLAGLLQETVQALQDEISTLKALIIEKEGEKEAEAEAGRRDAATSSEERAPARLAGPIPLPGSTSGVDGTAVCLRSCINPEKGLHHIKCPNYAPAPAPADADSAEGTSTSTAPESVGVDQVTIIQVSHRDADGGILSNEPERATDTTPVPPPPTSAPEGSVDVEFDLSKGKLGATLRRLKKGCIIVSISDEGFASEHPAMKVGVEVVRINGVDVANAPGDAADLFTLIYPNVVNTLTIMPIAEADEEGKQAKQEEEEEEEEGPPVPPLYRAVCGGNLDEVKSLLEANADPRAATHPTKGVTAIFVATVKDLPDIAEQLLKHNADPNQRAYQTLHYNSLNLRSYDLRQDQGHDVHLVWNVHLWQPTLLL